MTKKFTPDEYGLLTGYRELDTAGKQRFHQLKTQAAEKWREHEASFQKNRPSRIAKDIYRLATESLAKLNTPYGDLIKEVSNNLDQELQRDRHDHDNATRKNLELHCRMRGREAGLERSDRGR